MKHSIEAIVESLRSRTKDDWNLVRHKVEAEYFKSLPEIKVIEVLRDYIDSVWAGPVEAERCWRLVLIAMRELDSEETNRIERVFIKRGRHVKPEQTTTKEENQKAANS